VTQSISLFASLEEEPINTNWKPDPLPSLEGIKDVEIDCETDGLEWHNGHRPIGIGIHSAKGSQYIPWGHKGGGNLDENQCREWARKELRNKHITNLNTRFDIHHLYQWGVDLEAQGCTVSDVSHYAALLDDNRRRFSLDRLAQDYLGIEKIGKELDATRMADYHASQVAPRAIGDVEIVHKLKEMMWPELDAQDLQRVRQLEDDIIFPVCEMERNAAPLDAALLEAWVKESEQEYIRCLYSVSRDLGFNVEPKTKDWVRVFEKLKLTIEHRTDKGAPSFTDDVLKHVNHPIVQQLRRASKLASLRSKFLVPYHKALTEDHKLRYALHQLRVDNYGTVRGRFSSSNKNIQQVPAVEKQKVIFGDNYVVRQLFKPESGVFLAADAKQIEYRIFAHYASSPKVLEAYKENPDISYHEFVWEMVKPYKSNITYKAVKNLNFAKVYGAGKNKIAAMLELPRAESDRFVADYDRAFPEIPQLSRDAIKRAEHQGFVTTIAGRRARFHNGLKAHTALNAIIQGSAADINKMKIIDLHRERKHTGFIMRFTVHDELCGDCPDKHCYEAVKSILNKQAVNLKVPILWDVQVGPNWAQQSQVKDDSFAK
tara:strand:+ start:1666 stop:3465 length:1800 start_codon:yes stop_codon:yes gene_type:complete